MLPNHPPLVIAEQFGTLEALHPGRIDLGPRPRARHRPLTIRALRRDVDERRHVPAGRRSSCSATSRDAVPGPGRAGDAGRRARTSRSGSSARASTARSSRRCSACPTPSPRTSRRRRSSRRSRSTARSFEPSEQLDRAVRDGRLRTPIVADDDETARRLFTSAQQSFTNIQRGRRGQLPPPIDDIETYWTPAEKERASAMLRRSFVGSPETARAGLEAFAAETQADELIIASAIHDHAARLRSYELLRR